MESNCKVCGLHKEACLHRKEMQEDKYDRRVTRIVWFALGFGFWAIVSMIIM
ncbi:hypothetical protein [Flavobacterium panacagri]|uniref:hypothetical protein n=1 Tax=Flavobacterium panacagri TaxID=3034146 RepID=UPI0025A52454|nr:hypothetical protein [Flavobacterium panacagri]